MKNLILQIQKEFIKALQAKNGWGKNEVANLYLNVSNKVMADYIIQKREFFAEQYGATKEQASRMSSGPYKNDPTMGGQQIPVLANNIKFRTKEEQEALEKNKANTNSAHSFTEGADVYDENGNKLAAGNPYPNHDYEGNPFEDEDSKAN